MLFLLGPHLGMLAYPAGHFKRVSVINLIYFLFFRLILGYQFFLDSCQNRHLQSLYLKQHYFILCNPFYFQNTYLKEISTLPPNLSRLFQSTNIFWGRGRPLRPCLCYMQEQNLFLTNVKYQTNANYFLFQKQSFASIVQNTCS